MDIPAANTRIPRDSVVLIGNLADNSEYEAFRVNIRDPLEGYRSLQ